MKRSAPLLAVALVFAPLAARGDEAPGAVPAKARALAERGRVLHDAGNDTGAIASLALAYVIAPSPALLFSLAQAYRLRRDCGDAALTYRRYLATAPAPEHHALAKAHLASVERCLDPLALHLPVDPEANHQVVSPPARTLATTRATATAPRPGTQIAQDAGFGLVLGGGISLAAAAYHAVQAREAAGEVTAAHARGARWKDIAPADARGRSAATLARLLDAGGALGIAGGIVTYLIGRPDERPRVAVATTQHGFALAVRWGF